jgi:Zn-dependent M16 (insulinase) family peptidase
MGNVQEPKKVVGKYAAGNEAGEAAKEFVTLNWVLAEDRLPLETELEMGFLDQLLLGTAASPLRKALNDSGLGEAVIGGGLQDELRQPIFSIGLKGVQPGDAEKVAFLDAVPLMVHNKWRGREEEKEARVRGITSVQPRWADRTKLHNAKS